MAFNYQTRPDEDDHDHSHYHDHSHQHHHHHHSPFVYQNHIPVTREHEPLIIEKPVPVPVPVPVQGRGNSVRKPVKFEDIPYLDTPDYPERTRRNRRTPSPQLTDRTKIIPQYIPYPVPYPVMSSATPAINYPQMSYPQMNYTPVTYPQVNYSQISYPKLNYQDVNYQSYGYPETVMVAPPINSPIVYNTPQMNIPQLVYTQPQIIEQKPLNPVYNVIVAERNIKPQIIETNYEIVRRKNPGKYLTYVD